METAAHSDIAALLSMLQTTGKNYDIAKIEQAYAYAADLHAGQSRASGEPYISHPIAVAEIVAGLELDTDSICAALLHDTVEDCSDKTDIAKIEKQFGAPVAQLVDGLTKIVTLNVEDKEEAHIENLRKMLLAMSHDVRVIFIKLCDRLHNMRTLYAKPEARRRVIALETMQVYAPLAHRLGMQKIKTELENLGLSYLDPIGYEEVKNDIERRYGQSLNLIENIRNEINEKLKETIPEFTLEGRIKSVYSIYKKMYNQDKSFDEIYDFYALRIIVNTELECYTALGIIHEMFNSMPGRFKDYISTPKPNLYRSLHTTVIGRDGIPFEVQIRTWEMHHEAEYGIAAHWKYKSGAASKEEMDKKLEWVSRLIETENGTRDPDEFMNAIKTDIFHDEVFVFTPRGDVFSLPQGANVIDFAFYIHSEVGNKMIGAKINGTIVPIDHVLENGEIVEILTSNGSKGPSRDWLTMVKTSEARNKIRQWFKKENRADNIEAGKTMVDNDIRRYAKQLTEAERGEMAAAVAARIGYSSADDMYNALGYGGLSVSKISTKLFDEYKRLTEAAQPVPTLEDLPLATPDKIKKTKAGNGVVIDGESGCMVKFAKCCNPLPGDDIVGFITKGFGVSVHKCDCPNVTAARNAPDNAGRWVSARWEGQNSQSEYTAVLAVVAFDRIGVMANLATTLADLRVSIMQIVTRRIGQDRVLLNIQISCRNVEHFNLIGAKIKTVKDVIDVTRGGQ